MNERVKIGMKLAGAAMAVSSLGACSRGESQPAPFVSLVDCRTDITTGGDVFTLKKGEEVQIGGISTSGARDFREFQGDTLGNFNIHLEKGEEVIVYPNGLDYRSPDMLYEIRSQGGTSTGTTLRVDVTCNPVT